MRIILDEWAFHDLLLDNGESKFDETYLFLFFMRRRPDRLVQPLGGLWLKKAFSLMLLTQPRGRAASKLFHSMLADRSKTVRVRKEEMPDADSPALDGVPQEDIYLARAYIGGNADRLVTTDVHLLNVLSTKQQFSVANRNDFLPAYILGKV